MNVPKTKLTDLTFHTIVESSPNAVVLVNEGGRIAYLNRQSETLFGFTSAELIGEPIEKLIPERYRPGHAGHRAHYAKEPRLRSMGVGRDLFGLHKDGHEFPVEIGLNPLVLVDGTWILATVIDITERKQADERFRQVVQSAPNAMVLVARDGGIRLVNTQTTVLFGYTEEELIGKRIEVLVPERIREHHPVLRDRFFANPQTRYMGVGRDLVGQRKDGSEVPIEVGLTPMETDEGLMALVSVIDITERKAQTELKAKKEAAEAAYKAKGELLAIASHDLKNPLAAISGLAQLMLEAKKADANASKEDVELLESIFEASTHMSEVVKGILENERLEQQGLSIGSESVDLADLCNDLLRFNQPAADNKGIKLVSQIERGISVHGDKTRLHEAFDNYVSNAVKFSPSGRTVYVSLVRIAEGRQAEFGVRDEGPGLTEDDKKKMFGKFVKLSARPTGGETSTGLGLSIVKAIVELHGGTVGCDSEYGHGAYFWARLPVR